MYLSEELDKTLKRYVGKCVTIFTFGGHRFIGRLVGLIDGGICLADAERLDEYDESNWYSSIREEERNRRRPGGGKETIILFPQIVSISCSDESLSLLSEEADDARTDSEPQAAGIGDELPLTREDNQLEVLIGPELFQRLQGGQETLLGRISRIRQRLSEDYGFALPPIRVNESEEIGAQGASFRWHALDLGSSTFPSRGKLVFAELDECELDSSVADSVKETREVLWMAPAFWIDESAQVTIEGRKAASLTSTEYFYAYFRSTLARHLGRFYTFDQTVRLVQQVRQICPSLIEDAIDRSSTVAQLHGILHQLIEERCSIRPLQQIIASLRYNWDAADQADSTVASCRLAIATWLCARFRREIDFVRGLVLSPETESRLARERASKSSLHFIDELRCMHRSAERENLPCALIVDPIHHRSVVRKLAPLLPGLTVLSTSEIDAAGGIADRVESVAPRKRSNVGQSATPPKKSAKTQPK